MFFVRGQKVFSLGNKPHRIPHYLMLPLEFRAKSGDRHMLIPAKSVAVEECLLWETEREEKAQCAAFFSLFYFLRNSLSSNSEGPHTLRRISASFALASTWQLFF